MFKARILTGETHAFTQSKNMKIWEIGTLNQLFIRGI